MMPTPNPAIKTGVRPPIRPYVLPHSLGGKLRNWRYLILRRLTQLGLLMLFIGTARYGWEIAGQPVLSGNLSASELLGVIPMADPFAVLQQLLTRRLLASEVLTGAAIMLVMYAVLGGRSFCAWVCPVNPVTDAAGWLRARLHIPDFLRISRSIRYWVLIVALTLSALLGVAAFEWVSPISMLHRELIYGIGLGMTGIARIFLLDLLVIRHGWCGHLCPLGAFYGLIGRLALLRVRFDDPSCSHCGECARACPEPQVLNLRKAAEHGMVAFGECTNCARCIPVCPENSLKLGLRLRSPSVSTPTGG
jgi:ferredoxin-type protein NapH